MQEIRRYILRNLGLLKAQGRRRCGGGGGEIRVECPPHRVKQRRGEGGGGEKMGLESLSELTMNSLKNECQRHKKINYNSRLSNVFACFSISSNAYCHFTELHRRATSLSLQRNYSSILARDSCSDPSLPYSSRPATTAAHPRHPQLFPNVLINHLSQ